MEQTRSTGPTDSNRLGAIPGIITRIAPFLLPALFFQSAIFALISPIPLFLLTLKNQIRMSFAALVVNTAILYYGGYREESLMIAAFWFAVGILFPLLIRRSGKIERSFFLTFAIVVLMIVLGIHTLSTSAQMGMIEYVHTQISIGMDHLIAIPDSPVKKLVDDEGRDGLYKQLLTELPSGILIAVILSLWVNVLFASQIIKGFLSQTFWANYKTPEWLVLPALASGVLFAATEHAPYFIGLNALKVIMVLYGFQGLSVFAHALNHWKVGGLARTMLFFLSVFIAMPLVLAIGFFDLWFDFRKKFVQP